MTRIREATTPGVKDVRKGVFEARLIDEGQGSSGYYSKELLQKYGPTTFSENRPCFANHATDADWENGRDVTKIMGKLVSNAEYREDADGKGALYAQVKVRPEWVDFVEEYKDVIGMSVSVSGQATEGEVDGRQTMIVESFDDTDPYRSVDFVVAAGRGGKVERMLESAKAIEEKTANSEREQLSAALRDTVDGKYAYVEDFDSTKVYAELENGLFEIEYTYDERGNIVFGNKTEVRRETNYVPMNAQENLGSPTAKESDMDLETLAEKIDTLAGAVNGLVEASRPAEESKETDRAAVVEAAIEAGLSKSARARVLTAVEAGETPEAAIESEKALKAEYEAEFKEAHKPAESADGLGRISESADAGNGFALGDLKF